MGGMSQALALVLCPLFFSFFSFFSFFLLCHFLPVALALDLVFLPHWPCTYLFSFFCLLSIFAPLACFIFRGACRLLLFVAFSIELDIIDMGSRRSFCASVVSQDTLNALMP